MTATPPDPDPARTPGLEPGGGVAPGEVPPDSAQTSGLSEPQPLTRRRLVPTATVSVIVLAIFVLLFVATGVFLVLNMFGVFS
jgi:Family of unknown function (DUF6480)